jgi:hypothetical protein
VGSYISKKVMTEADKTQLTNLFEPLINDYKKKFIEAKPNKKENYIVNFYSKFYRGFFIYVPNTTLNMKTELWMALKRNLHVWNLLKQINITLPIIGIQGTGGRLMEILLPSIV